MKLKDSIFSNIKLWLRYKELNHPCLYILFKFFLSKNPIVFIFISVFICFNIYFNFQSGIIQQYVLTYMVKLLLKMYFAICIFSFSFALVKSISKDNRNKQQEIDFEKNCNSMSEIYTVENYNINEERYMDYMSGIEFEQFCEKLLLKCNFENVELTQCSGDHGIDILAEKDGISYAIQCKCYSSNIGNSAVQQAHTGKSLYHKDIAVVMTNRYFTAQAIDEAEQLGVKLWDRDKINEMIKK